MANVDEEGPQVYVIPDNYDDSGSVLGGRLKTRNCIELGCICGPIAFIEYKLLHFGWQTNAIIFLVTLVPLAALCIFGISDQSCVQFVWSIIRFLSTNRRLKYDCFTTPESLRSSKFSIDKFFDTVSTSGFKKALSDMREESLKAKQEAHESQSNGKKKKKKKKKSSTIFKKKLTKEEEEDLEIKEGLRRQEKAIGNQTKGWLSRAKQVRDQSKFTRGKR